MASLQDTIDIVIRAQDEASTAIRGVGSALSAVDEKVQAIAAPFASMADKVLLAQGAITGLGAALVKTGVDEAGKFEQSFKFITTLFEGSSESVSKFRQDILDYASGSTQSLESITNALQEAIGAGVDYSDSLNVLAEAEKLAIAQGATLDETVGLLTDTLQAYGLSMDDASKLSNQFSVAIRDGKVSASELASQLSNVSPIAAAAGVGFDQVGSAIAVLTTQGYPAGQAITAIKAILEGIIRPTADASKYADELGISFGSATLKSDGLQGVLQKVYRRH
jgi:TP901 family phage tail tape measure protein